MSALDSTTPATRFHSFHILRTSYKTIGTHEIGVAILVPKGSDGRAGKHPIMVKFHGGGLITGDCMYADWFAGFLVPFIHRHDAILVMPNYRLLPEHTGADVLSDLADFWTWLHSPQFLGFLTSRHTSLAATDLDLSRVLAVGDSAGGYLALMSGLTQPQGSIRAVIAQYPMTYYLRGTPNMPPGESVPGTEVIDAHMAGVKPGVTAVSSATPPARMELSLAIATHERYLAFFGDDKSMWPLYRVEQCKQMPPTWIVHGEADSVVGIEDSLRFMEKCKLLGIEARLEIRPGQEHGFDDAIKESEEKWLADGLRWIGEKWVG